MAEEWRYEAIRTCPTCHGTGKPPKPDPTVRAARPLEPPGSIRPMYCAACSGTTFERRPFESAAKLRDFLATLERAGAAREGGAKGGR